MHEILKFKDLINLMLLYIFFLYNLLNFSFFIIVHGLGPKNSNASQGHDFYPECAL
jgi:hypothetical protein